MLVTEDGVVGILCKAWPVAVTEKAGDFHYPAEGKTIATAFPERDYSESLRIAAECAAAMPAHRRR